MRVCWLLAQSGEELHLMVRKLRQNQAPRLDQPPELVREYFGAKGV